MRFRTGTGAALCIALAAISVPAAAQGDGADQVVTAIEQDALVAVVNSLGHQIKSQGEPGNRFVAAEDAQGTTYMLIGTACDAGGVSGCQGIMMQVHFDLPPTTTLETLAAANLERAALTVWADFDEKTLGFTRYHVLDGGVTLGNIRANVNVLLGLVADVFPVAAGAQEPPPSP